MTEVVVGVADAQVVVGVDVPVVQVEVSGTPGPPGPPGPEGPQGPPGTAYLNSQWDFNQNTAVSPANGTMRMNATTYPAATLLWISELDRDNLDRHLGLDLCKAGDQIIMQSAQGRAVWDVTSHADSGVYRTIGVTLVESSGSRPSAGSKTTLYFVTEGGATGHTIQDEGAPLTARSALNFVGAGVTATDDAANDRTLVTIPGASGGSTILSGTATPTAGTGAVGDYYLDTDDRVLYGPKIAIPGGDESPTPPLPALAYTSGAKVVGNKVRFAAAGYVKAVRVYWTSSAAFVPGYEVYLFSTAGTILGSKDVSVTFTTGWNTVTFDTPVPVAANTTYVVAFWAPSGPRTAFVNADGSAYLGYTEGTTTFLADGVDGPAAVYSLVRDTYPSTDTTGGMNLWAVAPVFSYGSAWPVALKSVPPGGTTGQVLKKTSATDYDAAWATAASSFSSRATASKTTASLAAGASESGTIALAAGYRLYRISTSAPARVRLYTTAAKRDSDAARPIGTDPTGDHGCVLEFVSTAGLLAADLSPLVDGFDGKATPDGQIPISITNTGTGAAALNVVFDWIRSE